jgi:hypothetical protein
MPPRSKRGRKAEPGFGSEPSVNSEPSPSSEPSINSEPTPNSEPSPKPSADPACALVALTEPADVYKATKKESEEGPMETAKVDIRKLQMLNDCINRTIEALNQVRLSVHGGGLSHSAPFGVQTPFGVQGLGTSAIFGGFPNAFNNPYVNPQIAQQMLGVQGVGVGLGHTAAYGNPLAQSIAQQAFANPFTNQIAYWAAAQQNPWNQNAWTQNAALANLTGLTGLQGLGHTGVAGVNGFDTFNTFNTLNNAQYGAFTDPYATARIAQTFPFVHWGYSPFGWPNV